MKTRTTVSFGALAMIGVATTSAVAEQEVWPEVLELRAPKSSVEGGLLGGFGEPGFLGMYSGVGDPVVRPILEGEYVRRDDETGTWLRIEGNDLGLRTRDARAEYERQGDWKFWLDLSQITKENPFEFSSPLSGVGTDVQNTTGAGVRELDLSTSRYAGEAGLEKRLSRNLAVNLRHSSEYKEGERQFGAHTFAAGSSFLTEPIDQWHHRSEVSLDYTGKTLQLSGGAIASVFVNDYDVLRNNVVDVALPPDNQMYKGYLSGAYKLTPTTSTNFKLAYSEMRQNESFFTAPDQAGNTQTGLDGLVRTYLADAGFAARPMDDLTVRGGLRYDVRRDETPSHAFMSGSGTRDGFNPEYDRETLKADAEATYRLPQDFSLTGSLDYERQERDVPNTRSMAWRGRNEEYTAGVQLRRRLTDTLGGRVGYSYSERDGDAYSASSGGTFLLAPIAWADRDRHKIRASADWAPTMNTTIGARVNAAIDNYDSFALGPREGHSVSAALDASHQLTRDWGLTGWLSRDEVSIDQSTNDGTQDWAAELTRTSYAAGASLEGRPTYDLKVGASLQYIYEKDVFDLSALTGAAVSDLSDVTFQQGILSLWSEYKLSDRGALKLGYTLTHQRLDEFAYEGWVYADGTTVTVPEQDTAHYLGISYRYEW